MHAWRKGSISRRKAVGWARAGGLGLFLACLGLGCIFQPRTAEQTGGTGPAWVQPLSLGNALGNMKRSLENKVLTNYGRSFSDAILEMVLDPTDLSDLGDNEFVPWSANQEEQRMQGILSQGTLSLSVTWTVRDSLEDSPGLRYYHNLGYRLTFSQGGRSAVYSGLVDLYFTDDGTGSWYITKWVDMRDPESANRSWGWLRGRNRVEFPGLF
jgi:hypothetical protein